MRTTGRRHRIRTIVTALTCAFVAMACLAGCVEDYDCQDIEAYVRATRKPASFLVGDPPTETKGEDGYYDRIWTVWVPSEGISYHVIDDYHWGNESLVNTLNDDYDATVAMSHAGELPAFGGITLETWVDEEGLNHARLVGDFSTRGELERCWEDLGEYERAMADLGHPDIDIRYDLRYQHPLRHVDPRAENTKGDSGGWTNSERDYDRSLSAFALCALDYRFDAMAEFTDAELAAAVDREECGLGVCTSGVDRPTAADADYVYEGLCAARNGDSISFSTLYEVAMREGVEVSGDPTHFSLVGADGATYEFSYDFHKPGTDEEFGEDYYLRDGEKTSITLASRGHLDLRTTREITDVPVYRIRSGKNR